MKVYDTKVDKYGWPKDTYDYVSDRQIPSGIKWELKLEMKLWNFIARIVNNLKQ